ncbi:MAG TPA: lysophospholipid acyltransferase family protein [Melioribacteraceae bacterium]|nr:lysophospholipid acyltransferase family protein [Melioribacteraceae bacterium]
MEIKNIKKIILRLLGNLLLYSVVNIVCKTCRIRQNIPHNTKQLLNSDANYVIAFWHGTMLANWYVNKNKNIVALVSPSKDGELLSNILNKWGYKLQRGSSNKSGKESLDILIELAKQNNTIALTPDGPKGPEKEFKAGAVIIAKKSNLPLILVGVKNKNLYRFKKSWDKFEFPKPFSEIVLNYSEPIMVNSDISYNETSEVIIECGKKLNYLQSLEY